MPNASNPATHKNKPTDYKRAKSLRHDSTDGEQVLWTQLREAEKTTGISFRRQHPIHPYIADFVCLKARLIVEVDGTSHDTRLDKDKSRDEALQIMGYEILRFTNEEVLKNCEGVVAAILNRAEEILKATTNPSP
jgi:very-short-patch-repair endonuclease